MYASCKRSNMSKQFIIHSLILASVLMPGARQIFASEESTDDAGAMILVLEDCDSDNKLSTDPYGDIVSLINSKGELVRTVARGLTITDGCISLSISEDGRFFAVCDRAANMLTVYETATGRKLWSLLGIFNSAVFANSLLYAYNSESIFAINNSGTIVKHSRLGAFDIAIDQAHNCFWISGLDVKKCNLDLEPVLTVERIRGIEGPLLIDVNPDGSIWIAQQNAYERKDSENRLVKVSPEGKVLQTINLEFSPARVCIDKSDGSVWTTGIIKERDLSGIGDELPETLDVLNELVTTKAEVFTCKYDSEGNWIFVISKGGYAIELDQSNGSAWIAGRKNIWHCSAKGQLLAVYTGSSDCQKWLAIIPGTKPNKIASR
jgi:hypothetical protein